LPAGGRGGRGIAAVVEKIFREIAGGNRRNRKADDAIVPHDALAAARAALLLAGRRLWCDGSGQIADLGRPCVWVMDEREVEANVRSFSLQERPVIFLTGLLERTSGHFP
jgi:hypothetical protein